MKNPMNTAVNPVLRLVGVEREARAKAMESHAAEQKLRSDAQRLLEQANTEIKNLETRLQEEKAARVIAEARLADAQQTIATMQSIKPPEIRFPDPDPAIARIERGVLELIAREMPEINLRGMTFDVRRDEFGKTKQIILRDENAAH